VCLLILRQRLGMAAQKKGEKRKLAKLGGAATAQATRDRLKPLEWAIKAALSDNTTLRKASDLLNERGIASPAGDRWHAPSLLKTARRLGLR
jgi:hypothetical protein